VIPSLEDAMMLLNGWMEDKKKVRCLLMRDELTRAAFNGTITGMANNVLVVNGPDKSGMVIDLGNAVGFAYADQREFGEKGKDYTDIVQGSLLGGLRFGIAVLT
jgi:hypothetical protein